MTSSRRLNGGESDCEISGSLQALIFGRVGRDHVFSHPCVKRLNFFICWTCLKLTMFFINLLWLRQKVTNLSGTFFNLLHLDSKLLCYMVSLGVTFGHGQNTRYWYMYATQMKSKWAPFLFKFPTMAEKLKLQLWDWYVKLFFFFKGWLYFCYFIIPFCCWFWNWISFIILFKTNLIGV